MGLESNGQLRAILEKIDELFADEIGPVAAIICDETLENWLQDIEQRGRQPSLRSMPSYAHKLSQHIDDEASRRAFVDAVFEIEALGLFKTT